MPAEFNLPITDKHQKFASEVVGARVTGPVYGSVPAGKARGHTLTEACV